MRQEGDCQDAGLSVALERSLKADQVSADAQVYCAEASEPELGESAWVVGDADGDSSARWRDFVEADFAGVPSASAALPNDSTGMRCGRDLCLPEELVSSDVEFPEQPSGSDELHLAHTFHFGRQFRVFLPACKGRLNGRVDDDGLSEC